MKHVDVIKKVIFSGLAKGLETFEFNADGYDYFFDFSYGKTSVNVSKNGLSLFDLVFDNVEALDFWLCLSQKIDFAWVKKLTLLESKNWL